ncbi:MAG: hypothetical protein Q7J79_05970 [Gemmatimonadales bacterium]|nr:hypothetical protein [Gemmatimonadales bacterium]
MKNPEAPALGERVVGEFAPQELRQCVRDPVGRASDPRILTQPGVRQCCCCRLANDFPDPRLSSGFGRTVLSVLEKQARVVVTRKQPEEQPTPQPARAAVLSGTKLDEPAVLVDRPDVLYACGLVRRDPEKVAAPGAVGLLLPRNLARAGILIHLGSQAVQLGGVERAWKDLRRRAIPDCRASVCE